MRKQHKEHTYIIDTRMKQITQVSRMKQIILEFIFFPSACGENELMWSLHMVEDSSW